MRVSTCAVLAAVLAVPACVRGGEATIRLQVAADGAEVAAYQQLIDTFEEAHPETTVELIPVGTHRENMAKLAADFAAGDPADVFLLNYRRFGQLARNGAIEPADPFVIGDGLDLDDFYPQPIEAFTIDGTLMCLPQNLSSLVVYYNRDLFREAGVPEPPDDWGWQEFLDAAKALTKDTDGDGATDVYGVALEPGLPRLAPFVWQAGAEVVDDLDRPSQLTLLTDEAIEAISFFIGLRRVHFVHPSVEEAEAEDPESRFARGGSAMMIESRRATSNLRAVDGLDFDVAPLPQGRFRANVLHSDAYCISALSDRKNAARQLVRFATSPEGARLLALTGRTVPAIRSVAESEAFLDPDQPPRRAQVFLDEEPYIRLLSNIATWHEIETLSEPIVEEWFFQDHEPAENLGIELDLATRHLFGEGAGP